MENPNENLSKAHLCVHGHLDEKLMTPHVCAMCWARPGRMGCILHGHTGLASLDHSNEPQNGAASPEAKASAAEFVAVRNRVAAGGNARFRTTCEAHHEALHAGMMPYQVRWLAGDEEQACTYAGSAEDKARIDELVAKRDWAGLRRFTFPAPGKAGRPSVMACDHAGTCAARVWRKRDKPEDVPTSCDYALSCVMRSCSSALLPEDLAQVEAAARDWQGMTPEQRDALLADSLTACRAAAMPDDVAARIGKRMRRAQKRQLRRICVLAFLRGMGKCAMLVFRVWCLAVVAAAAIALGIGLVVLFLTGVLWLIY